MTPTLQTVFGAPYGNCFAATLASLFDVPLDSIPWPNDGEFWALYDAWAHDQGFAFVHLDFPMSNGWVPPGFHLGSIMSPRGPFQHSVVCHEGVVIWDPHPAQDAYDLPVILVTLLAIRDFSKLTALLK